MQTSLFLFFGSLLLLPFPALATPLNAPPSPKSSPSLPPNAPIYAANADQILRPGDVLFEYEEKPLTPVQGFIRFGQAVLKAAHQRSRPDLKKADAGIAHVAIYVGKGWLAEAEGTHPGNTRLRLQTLDAHAGFRYKIFRSKDTALARRAAEIAKIWAAESKVGYYFPFHALFVGPKEPAKAKATALRLAAIAKQKGGLQGYRAMFCSQFVFSAYQAAALLPKIKGTRGAAADTLRLPLPLALYAENVSPMEMHQHFLQTSSQEGGFQNVLDLRVSLKHGIQREGIDGWLQQSFLPIAKQANSFFERLKPKKRD